MSAPARIPVWFVALWVFGWSGVVLTFDGLLGWALYQQLRATTFPTTDGTVTRSAVKTEGDSHRLDVAYTYTVAGRQYTGRRYSSAEMGTNTRAWHKVRDGLPVGAPVRVAYNPSDPTESMLKPGFTGFHLMMVWFLTPFNVIMVGGWVYAWRSRRPAFGPHSLTRTPTGWRVKLPDLGRAGCFGIVLLAVTFVGSFAWAFGCGFNPPPEYAGPGYVTAVALALLATRLVGPSWFEVDEVARVLRLPAEVPFDAALAVFVTHEEEKDSEGGAVQRYHCDLMRASGEPVRAATYSEHEPAEALAAWLRERIGLAG